jgi:nitrite reductase/ring-hydroxylating ferredoxin subunit
MNRRELITAMGAAGLLPMVAGCSELLPDPAKPETPVTPPGTSGTPGATAILTLNSPTKVATVGQFNANGQVVVAALPTNLSLTYPVVLVAVSSPTAVAGAIAHPSVANLYLVAYSRVCPHANEIVDTPVNGKMTCVIGHGQEFDGTTGQPIGTKNKTIQALAAFTLEVRNTNEIWVVAVGRDAGVGANGGVDSSAPTVTLAASSTNLTVAGKVTLTATATEEISASSGLDRIEFYEGTTLLGTATVAPFTLDLNLTTANNGTHNYIANAFDKATNMGSASVSVVVNIATDATAPTISLSASNLNVTTAGAVTLTATAADNAGGSGLARVEFYEGATLLGTVSAAPYSFAVNFTNANVGAHNYIAKAFDKAGNTSSSTSVTITNSIGVQAGDTTAPTITLAASSLNITAAGSLTLTATAADNAGGSGMAKVEFYEGATLLATKTAAPYTHVINFASANNGSHAYTAKAYDLANNSASSTPAVSVTVNIAADTTAPTVGLSASSLSITAAGSVTLTATAADNAGGSGLARVEFYEGTTLLATKTASPFTHLINYAAVANGSHVYTAKAFDNANNSASSTPVTVTVNILSAPTGAKIADYAQLASPGSSIEFNHTDTTLGSKSKKGLLYRSIVLQASGVAANGMNLVAYQLDCSHKRCFDTDFLAPTAAHILECSCHSALFNLENNGSFTKPATKALTTLQIEGRADGIYLV